MLLNMVLNEELESLIKARDVLREKRLVEALDTDAVSYTHLTLPTKS